MHMTLPWDFYQLFHNSAYLSFPQAQDIREGREYFLFISVALSVQHSIC